MQAKGKPGSAVRPLAGQVYYEPEIELSLPIPARVNTHTFLTPIDITSASPIATYQSLAVGATNEAEEGKIYFVGSNLGASIAAGSDTGIGLLRAIVTKIVRPHACSNKIRRRLVEGSKRSLPVALNDTTADQTESITLPSRYHRAMDIPAKESSDQENNSVRVTVPRREENERLRQQVAVLSLAHLTLKKALLGLCERRRYWRMGAETRSD